MTMTGSEGPEQHLLQMQDECNDALLLLSDALAKTSTPELEHLNEQWKNAQEAVRTLLEIFHQDPTRDLSALTHCVLWFMISHSRDLDFIKGTVHQTTTPAEKRAFRASSKVRRPRR